MDQQQDGIGVDRLKVEEGGMVRLPVDLLSGPGVKESDYVALDVVGGTLVVTRSSPNGPA